MTSRTRDIVRLLKKRNGRWPRDHAQSRLLSYLMIMGFVEKNPSGSRYGRRYEWHTTKKGDRYVKNPLPCSPTPVYRATLSADLSSLVRLMEGITDGHLVLWEGLSVVVPLRQTWDRLEREDALRQGMCDAEDRLAALFTETANAREAVRAFRELLGEVPSCLRN